MFGKFLAGRYCEKCDMEAVMRLLPGQAYSNPLMRSHEFLGQAWRTILFVAALSALSVLPCAAISGDFHQTYALQPGGTFDLQNVNGAVEIEGWDRNEDADRKSTRLNSSHLGISYAVFCL